MTTRLTHVSTYQSQRTRRSDTTPPPQVSGTVFFGTFDTPAARIDPLIFDLRGVEPGTKLQVVNRSANPRGSWRTAIHLPGNTKKILDAEGSYRLALGDKQAAKLGIKPGDVLEIRQVDSSGNASKPAVLSPAASYVSTPSGPPEDQFGVNLRPMPPRYTASADGRPPKVMPGSLHLRSAGHGALNVVGSGVTEPGATVTVTNLQPTQVTSQGVTDDKGNVRIAGLRARTGDPIHIVVTDRNGQSTDLGIRKAP